MRPLQLDAVVLELEKEDGIADLEECGTEIGELHHPEIAPLRPLDLAPSERVHVGPHDLYHLFADSEPSGVLGCDDRMAVRFERREMVVVEESGERTDLQVRTEEPPELVREKRGIE